MIVMLENGFSIRPARPRARWAEPLHHHVLADIGLGDDEIVESSSWLFSALAIADSSAFFTSTEILLLENCRSARAVEDLLPRISCASRLSSAD